MLLKKIINLNEIPVLPIKKNVKIYNEMFKIYEDLYINTKNNMHKLNKY